MYFLVLKPYINKAVSTKNYGFFLFFFFIKESCLKFHTIVFLMFILYRIIDNLL